MLRSKDECQTTTGSTDPCLLRPPSAEPPSHRNTPSHHLTAWSAPIASATSAETVVDAPSLDARDAQSPAPGCVRPYRHGARNIPKVGATTGSLSPGSYRAR